MKDRIEEFFWELLGNICWHLSGHECFYGALHYDEFWDAPVRTCRLCRSRVIYPKDRP